MSAVAAIQFYFQGSLGHVFWGQEILLFPPVTLLYPDLGRVIISSSTRTLALRSNDRIWRSMVSLGVSFHRLASCENCQAGTLKLCKMVRYNYFLLFLLVSHSGSVRYVPLRPSPFEHEEAFHVPRAMHLLRHPLPNPSGLVDKHLSWAFPELSL